MTLKARLERLRQASSSPPAPRGGGGGAGRAEIATPTGWEEAGPGVLWRRVFQDLAITPVFPLPRALKIVVPDFRRCHGEGEPEIVFFDLETTGLSGGAGTVAFLGALGFLRKERLEVEQWLLLDYPGEAAFLTALSAGFYKNSSGKKRVLTFNGKTFDFQILSSRCRMNGLPVPEYVAGDLLHPARRLWKRVLPSCRQGEIEAAVLGFDRGSDISGALAPDIWFAFLKDGDFAPLEKVCDHNVKDLAGLAALFGAFTRIAADPVGSGDFFQVDLEALALHWRFSFKILSTLSGERTGSLERLQGQALLREAAARGSCRAALRLGLDELRQTGDTRRLRALAEGAGTEAGEALVKILACRALAIAAERRQKDPAQALRWTGAALSHDAVLEKKPALRADLCRRRERLLTRLSR